MKHVIYFSAPWCAPCTTFAPQFAAVMAERQDVTFEKVNIDANIEKARAYGVRAIPCIVILNDGKEIHRLAGANAAKTKLEQALA
jgi:thioredoxin-like negative regulator of GroEL